MLPIPAVKKRDERKEADADDRVESDEPGGGQLFAQEDEVELLIAPDEVGVKDLIVRHNRDGEYRNEEEERNDSAPVASGEFRSGRRCDGARLVFSGAKIFLAREVDGGGEEHADAGRGETVMPAVDFAKRADDE